MTYSYKGQATVYIAILALIAGIVAYVVVYGMNSRQNYELANDIAQSLNGDDVTSPEIEDLYMETIEHAVQRHGEIVRSVVKYCNSHSGNAQAHLHWESPKGPRDAWVCKFPDDENWWIVVEGKPVNGDNIVTAFPRKAAQTLDDVIKYLKDAGYR